MLRFAYTVVMILSAPLLVLRLLWKSRQVPGYRQCIGERFGFGLKVYRQPVLWLHAVSVGETQASVELVNQLQQRYPHHQILMTNMTPTGKARVQALFGDHVIQQFLPYDIPLCLSRFLRHYRPQLGVIMETELWPNLLHCAAKHNVPIVIANARLSEKSALGYQRFAKTTQKMMSSLHVVAITQADAERFIALGASQVTVSGSIKFDLPIPDGITAITSTLQQRWSSESRFVLVAGSTRIGEEALIVPVWIQFKQRYPNALLVLAPRHPERCNEVQQLCEGNDLTVVRHSSAVSAASADVVLGDTLGEMVALYSAADVVYVGGSLVACGCHNVIEPALLQKPIVVGPSNFNFADAVSQLQVGGGLTKVTVAEELLPVWLAWADDQSVLQAQGVLAGNVAKHNQGALERLLQQLKPYIH